MSTVPLLTRVVGAPADEPHPEPTIVARGARWLLLLLVAYVTAAGVYRASVRPFWYDEIFTVTLARLPSMGAVVDALDHAADMNPPGFYAVERTMSRLAGNERIGYRLCSIVAVPLVSVCLFAFVRRRTDSVSALVAAVVPLLTVLYRGYAPETGGYAIEARPYAAVVACLAVALVAWQRISGRWWSITLAAALAAAVSLHYFAVVALMPFVLAEVTHLARWRHWRWRVWLPLAVATVPFGVFWPLLRRLREYYGANYWVNDSLHQAIVSYDTFLSWPAVGTAMGLVVGLSAALLLLVEWAHAGKGGTNAPATAASRLPPEEAVLALGFLWLPWMLLVVTRVAGGGMAPRYAMAAVAGLAISGAYVAHGLGRRAASTVLVCVLAAFTAREIVAWRVPLAGHPGQPANLAALETLLERAGHPDLPVVVSNGLDFVPLTYYATLPTSARLASLLDAPAAREIQGTDSVERDLTALQPYWSSMRLYPYDEFARTHDAYLLWVTPGFGYWWPARLVHDGLRLQVAAALPGQVIYLVTRGRS